VNKNLEMQALDASLAKRIETKKETARL